MKQNHEEKNSIIHHRVEEILTPIYSIFNEKILFQNDLKTLSLIIWILSRGSVLF